MSQPQPQPISEPVRCLLGLSRLLGVYLARLPEAEREVISRAVEQQLNTVEAALKEKETAPQVAP
jgi:hypothetical protein